MSPKAGDVTAAHAAPPCYRRRGARRERHQCASLRPEVGPRRARQHRQRGTSHGARDACARASVPPALGPSSARRGYGSVRPHNRKTASAFYFPPRNRGSGVFSRPTRLRLGPVARTDTAILAVVRTAALRDRNSPRCTTQTCAVQHPDRIGTRCTNRPTGTPAPHEGSPRALRDYTHRSRAVTLRAFLTAVAVDKDRLRRTSRKSKPVLSTSGPPLSALLTGRETARCWERPRLSQTHSHRLRSSPGSEPCWSRFGFWCRLRLWRSRSAFVATSRFLGATTLLAPSQHTAYRVRDRVGEHFLRYQGARSPLRARCRSL